MSAIWSRVARKVSEGVGSPLAFLAAVALLAGWAASGPFFGFGDTWQLVINTTTTIVTFLMVFLIQQTQNHDTRALNLKIDELLRAVAEARTEISGAEDFTEERLDAERAIIQGESDA